MPKTPGMVEVNIDQPSDADQALNEATETVTEAATRYQMGIMITRTGPGRYIVRAHPAVPFGLIRQQYS
ncbi:hypothetical protein [Arthrobacter sp. SLBN-112]|uniref:hypothetical protein n=1 Tax=Arthrobacter sp. SLBN-112 TaxID=2768452 RepID=UPI0027B21B42|nr:hypothetical protein [Arthrobacter sp. SLBN-112]MDQ0801461.1 hypothetical protein [Arthrobacter sp. SLBN-112]